MSELHPILAKKGIQPGTPEAFIAVANAFVGTKEMPKNSNRTIFGKWYGVQTAWCAMFVSYCLNHSGNGSTINGAQSKKGYALCSKGIAWFKKKKAWYGVINAKPGDIAFFDWNHDHSPEHTGLIVKVDVKRKRVLTIEGNTGRSNLSNGGQVMKQWRSMSTIMGIGRPAWPALKPAATVTTAVTTPEVTVVAPTPEIVTPVKPAPAVAKPTKPVLTESLKVGSKGSHVKYLQKSLHIPADGIFGPATKKAVMSFQKKHGIKVTGTVGKETWSKIA